MALNPADLLNAMFRAAIEAAAPAACVPPHLPPPPRGRTIVIGAGKASAAMAQALEAHWPPQAPLSGLIVTRYHHAVPCRRIEVVQAAHPLPDEAGRRAAARMLDMVSRLGRDDLVIALMSGGGSALLVAPAGTITLSEKQAVSRALLRSGAAIGDINTVRKHVSAVKGGRLAVAAFPARTVTLLISDVPGDDPGVIASGPTVADATTSADAMAVLRRYDIDIPASVAQWLADPASETIKPGDPRLAGNETIIVAAARQSLGAACAVARRNGVLPVILGVAVEGEARAVACAQATIALDCAQNGTPAAPPCALISGGETTVTLRGGGRGGRNTEFLLALGVALRDHPAIYALAGDTDGIDGTETNAGALLTPDFLARCAAHGIDPLVRLNDNDGYSVFAALGDLVVTGPTMTNVNDFRAILMIKKNAVLF